jgi:hypothetical protein
MTDRIDKTDANRDPITGSPGSHPVGTGVGTAVGTAIGAAAGALGGPATAAAGAAVGGAIAGGLVGAAAGHAAGEKIDPTVEDTYWANSYTSSPYVPKGSKYETFRPAYRYGWESYPKYHGKKFDDVERDLASDWDNRKDGSTLTWEKAKPATRDAWGRLDSRCGCAQHAHK